MKINCISRQQTWTTKNLDVSTYRNGEAIPQVQAYKEWDKLTTGAWCYHEHDTANGIIYGKLYNWYALNDPRGLAPKGYHIPSDAEWSILTDNLGENPGRKMKSISEDWRDEGYDENGTNSSGFNGLPGGSLSVNGCFDAISVSGGWWSSSEDNSGYTFYRSLKYDTGSALRGYGKCKSFGFSVRCLLVDSILFDLDYSNKELLLNYIEEELGFRKKDKTRIGFLKTE